MKKQRDTPSDVKGGRKNIVIETDASPTPRTDGVFPEDAPEARRCFFGAYITAILIYQLCAIRAHNVDIFVGACVRESDGGGRMLRLADRKFFRRAIYPPR